MRAFPFKKLDAFTNGRSSGNPAGYISLGEGEVVSDEEMQRIARELKGYVNEVGFLRRLGDEFGLRFFSSECEVEFCGHATIAIMYDLIRSGGSALLGRKELSLRIGAERLTVFNNIPEEDAVYIMAPPPRFLPCAASLAAIAAALGIDRGRLDATLPLKVIYAGLKTLIVPLESLEYCLDLRPEQEALRLFCAGSDIDIVLVFCRGRGAAESRFRTRVFAPKYGYLEDPATGSGNAAFGHYLIERASWPSAGISLEQGPSPENPNIVRLRRVERGGETRVLFGGAAVLRIEGTYRLQD